MTHERAPESAVALDESASSAEVDEAIERVQHDVARAVRRICPRWLYDQVDDLMQVATVRIVQRLRETAGTSVVLTQGYVYRVAYSALIDEIRKRRRLREVPIEPDEHGASHVDDPERRATAGALRGAIKKCLAGLVITRRRAVMLHLQGHSLDQTSALLGCRRKQADNLVYRGLADLRACLKTRGFEP